MRTLYTIINPDGQTDTREVDWPREPGYDRLYNLLEPLLDADLEHVSVLADFEGGTDFKAADMFVDECGVIKARVRNEAATVIYRRSALLRMPSRDPEGLPFICGPAILFSRRVWF